MTIGQQRGPKPLTARDWLFGSRPRRLALRFVLENDPGEDGWTKSEIALKCSVDKHGGISRHVDGLVAIGLLHEKDRRYWPLKPTKLSGDINALLDDVDLIPDKRVADLVGPRP